MKFSCTKDLFRIIHGRKQLLIQIRHNVNIISWGGGQIYGWFVILMVDESDLENITNQWINDIRLFNNEHIIQHHNIPQSNIHENHVTFQA